MDHKLPSVDELIAIALDPSKTDFLGDLGNPDNVANSIDAAVEYWEDHHPRATVPLELVIAARNELSMQTYDILADLAEMEAERIRDEQEAGDRDRFGNFIRFPRSFA